MRNKSSSKPDTKIRPGTILNILAKHYNVPKEHFTRKSEDRSSAWLKQVYVYCLWLLTDMRQHQIGVELDQHQANIGKILERVRHRILTEKKIRQEIIEVESLFEEVQNLVAA